MVFRLLGISVVLLSGCNTWPDVPPSEGAEQLEWPILLPIEDILAAAPGPDDENARQELIDRAQALEARAAVLRRPIADDNAMATVRESLAR